MDTLTMTKNELISVLRDNGFDHLTKKEQSRLLDYLKQILSTLQDAAELRHARRRQ